MITTEKSARTLKRRGFALAQGLPTWSTHRLGSDTGETLTITALPGQHAPGLAKRLLPPVMGSMLEYRRAAAPQTVAQRADLVLYISGDTLLIPQLEEIPRRYPDLDAAVLHLGGTTLPGGLMVTMDATQGADLIELLGARTNVPVHNDDYGVFKSSLDDFKAVVGKRALEDRVRYVAPGETVALTGAGPD